MQTPFKNQFSFLLIFIIFITIIHSEPISILTEITLDYNQNDKILNFQSHYKLLIPSSVQHLKIKTIPFNLNNHIKFYISNITPTPSYSTSIFKAENIGVNTIILSPVLFSYLYISVYSSNDVDEYNLQCFQLDKPLIEEGEELSFVMEMEKNYEYIFKPNNSLMQVFIYAIVGHIEDITIEGRITDGKVNIIKRFSQRFRNGYGLLIDLLNESEISIEDKDNLSIIIKFFSDLSGHIQLGIKKVQRDVKPAILLYRETIGYIDSVEIGDCYTLPSLNPSKEKTDNDSIAIMNIISYPSSANIRLCDSNGEVVNKYQPNMIDSIELNLNESITQLCIDKTSIIPSQIPYITYSIQLFPTKSIESSQQLLSPLLNNIQSKFILPAGQAIGLRRKSYNSFLSNLEIEMHLHSLVGNPQLYGHKCLNYPCKYSLNEIGNLTQKRQITKANQVNDHFTLFLSENESQESKEIRDYDSASKSMMVIACPNGIIKCVFYASMFEEGDHIELLPIIPFYQLIIPMTQRVFYHTITSNLIASISFVIQLITGDAKMTIEKKGKLIGQEVFFGNKNIVTFTKTKTINNDQISDLIGDYFIVITCNDHSYFSFSIELIKENQDPKHVLNIITTGETTLQSITQKEGIKTFGIKNRIKEQQQSNLIITINPINCVIKYSYQHDTIQIDKHYQVIIPQFPFKNESVSEDDDEFYSFQISFIKNKVNIINEDNICMLYIASIESYSDNNNYKKLVLNEGIEHLVTLSNTLNPFYFTYPFSYDITFTQAIIISINYEKIEIPLKITVIFEGIEQSDPIITTLNRPRKLIYYNEMKHSCELNMLCNVHIIIEPKQLSQTSNDYYITIESLRKIPSYITPNQYHKNILIQDNLQYYYTDIGKDEQGEVMVMFNKGNGNIYARIISKALREEDADWNEHLILPSDFTQKQGLNLEYDYLHSKIHYTKKDTSNCGKGCELFIGVQAEIYSKQRTQLITEYDIITRQVNGDNNPSVIIMNVNEYYYGNIGYDSHTNVFINEKYYQYSFICPYESDEIRIHLISENAIVYIKEGDIVKENDYDWFISYSTGVFNIKKSETSTQFYQMKFSILVLKHKHSNIKGPSFFAIKASVSTSALIQPLTYISSDQNELCSFKINSDANCNIIRSVKSYEQISNFYMLIESIDNYRNSFIIYVNILSAEVFETKFNSFDLPNKMRHEFSSNNNVNKHYLWFNNQKTNKMTGNYYVIITIVSTMKGKGIFTMSSYGDIGRITLHQKHKTMMRMEKNSNNKSSFSINGSLKYFVSFNVIEGKGRVIIDQKSPIALEQSTIVEVVDKQFNEEEFIVETLSDILVYYIIYYGIVEDEGQKKQMIEINYGKENKVIPLKAMTNENQYYFKLFPNTIEGKGTTIAITVRFILYQLDSNEKVNDEDLELSAQLTNTLNKNPTTIIQGQYDPISHIGIILLQAISLKIDHNFALITLSPSKNNTNLYSTLQSQISAYPINFIDNSMFSLPQNKYYQYPIETGTTKNILKLSKMSIKDTKIIIEFSSCSGDNISYAIHDYTRISKEMSDRDLFKSDPQIKFITKSKYRKTFITIEMNSQDYTTPLEHIAFVTYRKSVDTMNIDMYYTVKYRSGENIHYESGYTIDPNVKIMFNQTMRSIEASWNAVIDIEDQVKEAEYIYSIVKEGDFYYDSICVFRANFEGNTGYRRRVINKNFKKVMKVNVENFNYEQYTNYSIATIALILSEDDEEIRMGYAIKRFTTGGDPPKKKNWLFYGTIIGIGILVVLLFIILFLYLLCKKVPTFKDVIEDSFQISSNIFEEGENSLLAN